MPMNQPIHPDLTIWTVIMDEPGEVSDITLFASWEAAIQWCHEDDTETGATWDEKLVVDDEGTEAWVGPNGVRTIRPMPVLTGR